MAGCVCVARGPGRENDGQRGMKGFREVDDG
jgi:hypothetical protein